MTPENLEARRDVELVITKLDDGQLRVAEIDANGDVVVHEWVQARRSCSSFDFATWRRIEVGPFEYLDKLELKRDYERRGVRVVPGRVGSSREFPQSRRDLDAQLRQHRRVGRARTRWSTPGPPSAVAPRSAPTSTSPAASVSVASSSRRTRCRSSSKTTPSSEVAAWWSKVLESDEASVLGAGTHLESVDSGHRRRRRARRSRAATCPTTASRCRRVDVASSPAVSSSCPCVLIIDALSEGERHNKVALNDTPARPRRRHVSRLDDALALVAIDSVSRNESRDRAPRRRRSCGRTPTLDVERIGDNVIARTVGHHATRLLVAGHLDTVPGDAGAAVIVGDELRGLGACDMKGSLAGDARTGPRHDSRDRSRSRGSSTPARRSRDVSPDSRDRRTSTGSPRRRRGDPRRADRRPR